MPADGQVELMQELCRYIESHLEDSLTLAALGKQAGLSPAHLQRVFKRIIGLSPRQYVDACRLGKLKGRLKQRSSVVNAMVEAGYNSSSRLYERAAQQLGMTPGTYRNGAPAVRIGYTLCACPLGRLLLAATERGICAVSLGNQDQPLQEFLSAEYPAAVIERDDAALQPYATAILRHLAGQQPHLDLPIDVQATAFQWRVWQELQAIPYGTTRSYAEIAQRIEHPKAVRAVARACATNPVAVVIPCHRVVRTDGGLGGYRWGIERKEMLLEQEKEQS
ncbi:MAG: methylated-DNA--[protein]-cysteine S-methyltransferase [Planctomycetia bacterium]|nr:methylated-DNA--[protein]-cysteine S-methyltransferase [Planctomycetia bacterium]